MKPNFIRLAFKAFVLAVKEVCRLLSSKVTLVLIFGHHNKVEFKVDKE